MEGERYLSGANAKASYKLSVCKVGHVLYKPMPLKYKGIKLAIYSKSFPGTTHTSH